MSRREQLEAMLAAQPEDTFLRYALAMETLKEGDTPSGIAQLRALIDHAPDYQAAYFQLAQVLVEHDEVERAKETLQQGIAAARRIGDAHAAEEMEGFLLTLG